jgi:hypothetical protein
MRRRKSLILISYKQQDANTQNKKAKLSEDCAFKSGGIYIYRSYSYGGVK